MSDEQYTWTPISVDDVVINETYVRATRREERGLVTEGLVVDRDREYLELMTEEQGPKTVDTDYRDLERRDPIPVPEFPAPVVGETFTRTRDLEGMRDITDCTVESVEPHDDGWRVEYRAPGRRGTTIVHRDGSLTNTLGNASGRFLRPVTGAWVQATPENVRLGSKIKGAPYRIGGNLEAEVNDLVEGDPTRLRARTLTVITPTTNGRDMDLAHGPLGTGYNYRYADVQVWQEAISPLSPQPPVTWHPVDFVQLRHGDTVRVTFTNARGQTLVKEGTVTLIQGARVSFRDKDGVGHAASSLRTFEISNRVPEPAPVLSDRYPTIHHLRAAIFDVAVPNFKNGTWCSDTNDFLRELGIVDNLWQDAGLKDQANQVQAMIAKLQGESASSRGISSTSLEKAFEALGIPKTPVAPPRQKMMTVTMAVPVDFSEQAVAELLNIRVQDLTVESVEES